MNKEVSKQMHPPVTGWQRSLDFNPFREALNGLTGERQAGIESLLVDATIPEIHHLFDQRLLNAEELAIYYLARIQQFDAGKLNTVMELNPHALETARALDQNWSAGERKGRLHGIPILIKGNIGTGDDMHTTAGAAVLAEAYCDRDAFLVHKLRIEGALLLGKTNLSEWANFMTADSANGYSALGGQTHNPYGIFDVGGSSSGSAAALAAGLAVGCVGTETSGSIIHPAGQNSVFGFKPTMGLVSRDRVIPITEQMDTPGPMARNATDLAILLAAMAGEDGNDPATQETGWAGLNFPDELSRAGLKGKRVALVTNASINRRQEDLPILRHAAGIFRELGADVVEFHYKFPRVRYLNVLLYGICHEVDLYLAAVGSKSPVRSMAEVVAFNHEDLANRAPYGQNYLEESLKLGMSEADYLALAQKNRGEARASIRTALAENHADILLSYSSWMSSSYATAGFPAVALPGFYRKEGEPVGLTIIGDYQKDADLLAAAYAFEQAGVRRRDPNLVAS